MDKQSIMIVGANGLLGSTLHEMITEEYNCTILSLTRETLHITNPPSTIRLPAQGTKEWRKILLKQEFRADHIINTAALTNLDKCETEREEAWRSNVQLVESLLDLAQKTDTHLTQISTDNVFDGKEGPYSTTDRPNPINYYGRTKLAAENLCRKQPDKTLIIRTMWLYGGNGAGRKTFHDWIAESTGPNKPTIQIATDEIGNPTHVADLAYAILHLIASREVGTYHVVGPDRVSRWEWANRIATTFNKTMENAQEVLSAELERKAERPLKSGLTDSHALTGSLHMMGLDEGMIHTMTEQRRNAIERMT